MIITPFLKREKRVITSAFVQNFANILSTSYCNLRAYTQAIGSGCEFRHAFFRLYKSLSYKTRRQDFYFRNLLLYRDHLLLLSNFKQFYNSFDHLRISKQYWRLGFSGFILESFHRYLPRISCPLSTLYSKHLPNFGILLEYHGHKHECCAQMRHFECCWSTCSNAC